MSAEAASRAIELAFGAKPLAARITLSAEQRDALRRLRSPVVS